jgi:outer membrane protein assembly factor BamB/predicted phosphohydrolase
MLRRLLTILLLLGASGLAAQAAEPTLEDFAFVHFTDTHLSPHLARMGPPTSLRGGETIAWICRETAGPQPIPPFQITTPEPAFALVTGDLTEYGVIDDTWAIFEQAFASLPCPMYVLAGNHDNTWVAMYHIMRARHGGENYSFDQFGCHFACISSASPQEPVPTIDAKTRAWLKRDLDGLAPGTPVFVALHHPLYSDEFANPAEHDTLIDLLRDYNVVLMLYGHGHGVSHRNMGGIDGVMGGSTFGKNAGYGVVSIQDGMLRVAYRYHHKPAKGQHSAAGPGWRTLLEKPLKRQAPQRLFSIVTPRTGAETSEGTLAVAVQSATKADPDDVTFETFIDGRKVEGEPSGDGSRFAWAVQVDGLTPGRHLLSVRMRGAQGRSDLRATTFAKTAEPRQCLWRKEFPAAVKAGPIAAGDKLFVARTDGIVTALQRETGKELWSFETGGEILGTPAWSDKALVFGSGDGRVYALNETGQQVWAFEAGLPVYGWPLIDGDTVFIGDNGGRMHALDLRTGARRWTFERADYAIESQACLWGDLLVFGAWDGYLYALHRGDGRRAWRVWGPKSSEGRAARYYAPADCGPVALGGAGDRSMTGTLFVCDRGYVLGTYDRQGAQGRRLETGVSAITAGESGQHLYCRTNDDRLCKFSTSGQKLWEKPVPAGRFPIPPTCHGDRMYVCSNRGLLSVLDAADGAIRWQYQVTPGFYVMAPVAVDDEGTCYVAGMDGSVTAVHGRSQ